MNKQSVYRKLEKQMVKYSDLAKIPACPVAEELVVLKQTSNLLTRPIDPNMLIFTGKNIYVRKGVAKLLKKASLLLSVNNPNLQLEVVYGYRTLSIQQKLFLKYEKRFQKQCSGIELLESVHRLIAVPEVAGHPTGGAVDVQILESGKPFNMGTKIWQFTKDSYTFSPFVSRKAQVNRQLLRQIMMKAGFAPFDGEWWHFSYGDKEWAKYYNQRYAIYEQIEFKKEV